MYSVYIGHLCAHGHFLPNIPFPPMETGGPLFVRDPSRASDVANKRSRSSRSHRLFTTEKDAQIYNGFALVSPSKLLAFTSVSPSLSCYGHSTGRNGVSCCGYSLYARLCPLVPYTIFQPFSRLTASVGTPDGGDFFFAPSLMPKT